MPTAAKLIGGFCLAIVFYIICVMYFKGSTPRLSPFDGKLLTGSAIGLVAGWMSLGERPGIGGFDSIASGWRAAILGLIVACLFMSANNVGETISTGGYGASPMAAVIGWIKGSFRLIQATFTPQIWIVLTLGGALAGRLAGMANKRWN